MKCRICDEPTSSIARLRYNGHMTLSELWPDPRLAITAVRGGYLLQAEHPAMGDIILESSAALNAAVARASELIKAGYRTEIWSPRVC
jgi:hypothetical protein